MHGLQTTFEVGQMGLTRAAELIKATDLSTAEKAMKAANILVGQRGSLTPIRRALWDVFADAANGLIATGAVVGEAFNSWGPTQWWKTNKLFRGGFAPIMRNIWTNVALTASQNPKAFLDPKFWDDMAEFVKDVANGNLSPEAHILEFQEFALGWMGLEGSATGGASGIGREVSPVQGLRRGRTAQRLEMSITPEASEHLYQRLLEAKEIVSARQLDDTAVMMEIVMGKDGLGGLLGSITRGITKPGEIGKAINERIAGTKGPVGSSYAVFNDIMAHLTNVGRGGISGADRFTRFFATWFNLGDGMFKYPLAKKIWFQNGPGALRRLGLTDEIKTFYKERGVPVPKKWWTDPVLSKKMGYLSRHDVYLAVTHYLPDYSRANEWIRGARIIDPFAFFQWKVMWGQFQFGMNNPGRTSLMNEIGGWLNAQQFDTPAEQFAYLYMRPEMRNRVADTPLGDYSFQYMNLNPDLNRMLDLGATPLARGYQAMMELGTALHHLLFLRPEAARAQVLQAGHTFTDHFFGPTQVNIGQMAHYAMKPALLGESGVTSLDWLYKALRMSGGSTIQKGASAALGVPHVPRWKTAPFNTNLEAETWKHVLASYVLGLASVPDPVKRGTQGWNRQLGRLKMADESLRKRFKTSAGYEGIRQDYFGLPPDPATIASQWDAIQQIKTGRKRPLGPDVPMTEELVKALGLRSGTTPQLLEYMPPPYSSIEEMTRQDPRAATMPIYLEWLLEDQKRQPALE